MITLRVKEIRERRGMTQEDLALKVKTTQTAISRLEHRRVFQRLDVALLERIAKVLRVSLKHLVQLE